MDPDGPRATVRLLGDSGRFGEPETRDLSVPVAVKVLPGLALKASTA